MLCFFFFNISQSDENDIALMPLNLTKTRTNNLHRSHQQIFQHQSSVSSTTSVQTVFHQSVYQSNTHDLYSGNSGGGGIGDNVDRYLPTTYNSNNIKASSNNQMILLGSNGNMQQTSNGNIQTMNPNALLSLPPPTNTAHQRPSQLGSMSSLTTNFNNQMFQYHVASHSSNVSIAEETLSIGDVADLLHPQYAIITGGRSREGCPIITFPDHSNFHLLTEQDYEKLITYLTLVPP